MRAAAVTAAVFAIAVLVPCTARAHCDALDGPVAVDARAALEKGDPALVLKWVRAEDEAEIRDAFQAAMVVREEGHAAKALADRYFLETLVRVHRAGEGAAFTGLKPAGGTDPGILAADAALQNGSAKELAERAGAELRAAIERRHATAVERRAHAAESVEAGRAYVAAYVDYVHFVEAVHGLLAAEGDQGSGEKHGHGHAH
jgi:hypothetical protein